MEKNDSNSYYPSGYSGIEIIVRVFIATIMIIFIVIGNLLVIVAIATDKELRKVQNWFIGSLAVADFLIGILIVPFSLANDVLGYWSFGNNWCQIHSVLDVFVCSASILSLCLIALDRYWSVVHPTRSYKYRSPSNGAAMITFVWFFSSIISIPPFFGFGAKKQSVESFPKCELSDNLWYVIFSSLSSFYVPCSLILFVYGKIHCVIITRKKWKQERNAEKNLSIRKREVVVLTNMESTSTARDVGLSSPSPEMKPNVIIENRVAFIMLLIVGTFILSWLPFFLLYPLHSFCKDCVSHFALRGTIWLGYMNSVYNPVLYTIFVKDFQKSFRRILFTIIGGCRPRIPSDSLP